MPKISVKNQLGEKVADINLNKDIFGIEPNTQAIFDAVQVYTANRRQATAKTKTRTEVRGGGKKPWKQKGTGRARQGSIRAPQWRGGGIVFGPNGEQSFKLKMNKKEKDLALKSALSQLVKEKQLTIVDTIKFEKASTKSMVEVLNNLKIEGKTLIVVDEDSINLETIYSVANIENADLLYYDEINTYELINHKNVIFTKASIDIIEEVLA